MVKLLKSTMTRAVLHQLHRLNFAQVDMFFAEAADIVNR